MTHLKLSNLTQTISLVIRGKYGWSVAEQFEKTFEHNNKFDYANWNALLQIRDILKDLILASPFLDEESMEYIKEYYEALRDYINN